MIQVKFANKSKNAMKKIIYLVMLISALNCKSLYSQFNSNSYRSIVVNAGVKLGYAWGEKSGFVAGFELTVGTFWDFDAYKSFPIFYGTVLNLDYVNKKFRITTSAEVQSWPIPGLTVGPSILLDKDYDPQIGITIGTYLTIGFLSLTYNYSMFDVFKKDTLIKNKSIDIHEIVTQIKYPLSMPYGYFKI